MKNYKELIFDYVHDELTSEEELDIKKFIAENSDAKAYYDEIKDDANLIDKSMFESVDDRLLDAQREILFYKIDKEKKFKSIVKEIKTKIFFLFGNPLKYAAVIALTAYVTLYHFADTPEKVTGNGYYASETTGQMTPVAFDYDGPTNKTPLIGSQSFDGYKISNLDVDRDGEDVILNFDISTHKSIRGKKDDPEIVYTLNEILKKESNPSVKLRSLRVIDDVSDDKLKSTLIKTMLNDNNAGVRRKAMILLTKSGVDEETKKALMEVIEKDNDAAMRIEALTILEKTGYGNADQKITDMTDVTDFLELDEKKKK